MIKMDLEQRILDQDKLQRSDHDTLIEIKTKLQEVLAEIKSLSDGVSAKIADHEVRLRKVEDALITYEPSKNLNRLDLIEKKVIQMESNAFINRTIVGVVSAAVFFVLTQLPGVLRSWGIIR